MKLLFVPMSTLPFHGESLEERPLGGTETGVINLASCLKKMGHEVFVISDFANPPLSDPLYVPFRALELIGPVDAFIAVRDWRALSLPIKARVRAFWTGDAYDQPLSVGIGDKRVTNLIDLFFTVSQWQRDTFCESANFPADKCVMIKNGIAVENFQGLETRQSKRLIYSSTPYRGLIHLLEIFPRVLQAHPEAELHIFSGSEVYRGAEVDIAQEKAFKSFIEPFRNIAKCTIHGNILQKELAREFMRSAILAYPNTFPETSCITAMEAQAAGCVPVTSDLGALPETVGDAGILIPGEPGSSLYKDLFVETICNLFSDQEKWRRFSEKGQAKINQFSWMRVAERVTATLSYLVAERRSVEGALKSHGVGAA